MRGNAPPEKWTVYGTARSRPHAGAYSITREFDDVEDAWRHLTVSRIQSCEMNAVLVHTMHRLNKNNMWRPVNTVVVRYGTGKAWFE